jgi:CDP-diacylglycerol--serine O-phosphatidyltransferase
MGITKRFLKKHAEKIDKKYWYIIPFFCTFSNAALGFASVLYALDDYYTSAAICLLLACFMDACDGRLARALGAESMLGEELDSLCDAISFCFAPAVLLFSWLFHQASPLFLIVLLAYLLSGLYRLAKFNIMENKQDYFIGLPTPIAAGIVAQMILYQQWFNFLFLQNVIFVAAVVLLIAYLMIAPIKIPSFK